MTESRIRPTLVLMIVDVALGILLALFLLWAIPASFVALYRVFFFIFIKPFVPKMR